MAVLSCGLGAMPQEAGDGSRFRGRRGRRRARSRPGPGARPAAAGCASSHCLQHRAKLVPHDVLDGRAAAMHLRRSRRSACATRLPTEEAAAAAAAGATSAAGQRRHRGSSDRQARAPGGRRTSLAVGLFGWLHWLLLGSPSWRDRAISTSSSAGSVGGDVGGRRRAGLGWLLLAQDAADRGEDVLHRGIGAREGGWPGGLLRRAADSIGAHGFSVPGWSVA